MFLYPTSHFIWYNLSWLLKDLWETLSLIQARYTEHLIVIRWAICCSPGLAMDCLPCAHPNGAHLVRSSKLSPDCNKPQKERSKKLVPFSEVFLWRVFLDHFPGLQDSQRSDTGALPRYKKGSTGYTSTKIKERTMHKASKIYAKMNLLNVNKSWIQ